MSHTYFAKIHADKFSQFFATAHNIRDTDEMTVLREKLRDNPDDVSLLLELAQLLNFQLRYRDALVLYDRAAALRPDDFEIRRARAPRYLATLQTSLAYGEYGVCDRLRPGTSEIMYRLGISAYILKKYEEASALFTRCLQNGDDTAESRVAFAYWLAMTEHKSGKPGGLWREFDLSQDVGHHTGYRDALLVLCGLADLESMYEKTVNSDDSLNGCIVLYALSAKCRENGEFARAQEIAAKLLAWDDFWPGFAYLAAWSERAV